MSDTELDGATEPGPDDSWPLNAGEFAARWNEMTPKMREEKVRHIQRNSEVATAVLLDPSPAEVLVRERIQKTKWAADARLLKILADAIRAQHAAFVERYWSTK